MKTLKKWMAILVATVLSLGICVLATACKGNEDDKGNATAYTFQILDANGNGAEGYSIQLCAKTGTCYAPAKADASGNVTYNAAGFPGEGVYDIHVLDLNNKPIAFEGANETPANYNSNVIVITLK